MFLHRISIGGVIALIVLAACAPPAETPHTSPVSGPTQPGITEGGSPVITTPTVATILASSPTPTPSSPPPPGEPDFTGTPIGPSPTRKPEPTLTLEPYPPPAPTEPPIDPDRPGNVSGEICSPGDGLPAMTAYFEDIESSKLTMQPIPKDQSNYQLDLHPSQYIAYAYLNRPQAPGGLYSEAVRCGLTPDCTDHNPAVFEVKPGQAVNGIDLCDWSAPAYVPPNPAPFDPRLAGMVYKLAEVNYFRYDARGEAHLLFATDSRLDVSPDGRRGVFQDYEKNDLFIVDFSSGEQFNLTNTPEVYETAYQWEPGLPKTILFTALKPGQGPDTSAGALYTINLDGSQRSTLDDEHEATNFDLSPDGQTIAYGAGKTAWLYTREAGATVFDPREYSSSLPDDLRIASPSWSPDGKRIAWYMLGFFSEQYQEAIGIFDLAAGTFQLIHPWPGNGRGPGYPPSGSWSPDGKWLAITPFEPDLERRGVWLVVVNNPEKETFMGASTISPFWSPDGKWLVYHDYQDEKDTHQVWLYNPNTGEHQETALPPDAWAVDW